jgi:hypothetical protein
MNYYQITHYVGLLQKWDMIEGVSRPFEGFRITDKGRILLNLFLDA